MKLIHSPNEWLDREVEEFDFSKYNAKEISSNMIDIMLKNDGIGLAANQVGFNGKIFVMKPFNLENSDCFAVINPVIKELGNEVEESLEGCLSQPGNFFPIKRPTTLVAEYLDISGEKCIINLHGIDARCFLHEYDHLLGIEFTDRISKLKRALWIKKSKKLKRRINHG